MSRKVCRCLDGRRIKAGGKIRLKAWGVRTAKTWREVVNRERTEAEERMEGRFRGEKATINTFNSWFAARIQTWGKKESPVEASEFVLKVKKSRGPCSILQSISSYICIKMINSKQNVHFIQYGGGFVCVCFFSLNKRANSLRKSNSCDICYSLPFKYRMFGCRF